MFGGLRKRLEEAVAQINPFDGGRTASTVRAARSSAPARTVRQAQVPYNPSFEKRMNRGLDQGLSWEKIANDNKVDVNSVRRFSEANRPGYGIKPPERNLASKLYDQVNIFDNNRTFKQGTPTQAKSSFQQAGQFGSQVTRGTVGGTARVLNTLAAQVPQVYGTGRMLLADATNNDLAWQNANSFTQAANDQFRRGQGGLFNTGTLYGADEAKQGDFATGIKRIGGGIAESGLEAASLGIGGFVGKKLIDQGLKQGFKTQLPNIAKNALLNTGQGAAMAYNQDAGAKDIARSALLSGVLGTGADVGLGVAGAAASKVTTKLVNTVKDAPPLNEAGSVRLPFSEGDPGADLLRINNPDNARMGLDINNPDGANIKPLKINNPMGAATGKQLKIKANTTLVGDNLSGAAQQSHLGKNRFGLPKLNEQGSIKNPFSEPEKPKGFIIKETKGRGGKKDTVRIGMKNGRLKSTVQSEHTPETKQYADTFGISPNRAAKDIGKIKKGVDMSGTARAMENAENSGKRNRADDILDQQEYGVKKIQATPENTIDNVINKYLGIEDLSDAQMNASNPKYKGVGAFTKGREAVKESNLLRMGNDALAKGFEKTSRGGKVARKFTRALQYINKNAGQDPAMVKAAKKYAGESTFADSGLLQVGKQAYDLLPNDKARARVHAVLDPESANGKIKITDLSDGEKQAASILRDLGDSINDTSYRLGFISKKKWESNRGGRYIARLYNEVASSEDVADLLELPDKRGLHLGMYKSRTDLNNELKKRLIRDPVKLAVIRARQVRQNEALLQYMQTAESKGYVSMKPKDGFVKVSPQNRMANWSGKYVRQDVFENIEGFRAMGKGIQALNTVLDVYDGNPARRLRKKMLTIYNPVVRAGNVTSNYFFAYLNGVNPATFLKNKSWAKKALKSNDPLAVAAQKSGLIGNDILRTDKNIFNKDKQFLTDLDKFNQSTGKKLKSMPKNIDDKLSKRYGNADDIAKLSALKSHVNRGIPINKAIEMTRRGFQDYTRVGHAYDMAAKIPVFGNAFIRFQGDLYANIIKNAAVDHPLRLAIMVGGIAALGNELSSLSGESKEDKKTREDRAGSPKIPFTDISTEFQTPVGAIDVARFTPLYMRQDIDGNSFADNLSRLSPVNIPNNLSKNELIKKGATDPLIGSIISLFGDTDWRGKSVKDPDGYRDGKALFPDNPLSKGEEWRNRIQYGVRSYAPYPFNEIGDIMAANNQDKKNEQAADGGKLDPRNPKATGLDKEGFNTAGSKKTVGQSLGRLFGIRAEQYGKDEAEKQRTDNEMFAFFDEVDKFKTTLDSTTKQQFEARHKGTATRDGIKAEFENDPWYKYRNASELLQNPKLFEAEKKYAQMQNKYDKRPIDPIFNLPKAQRNLVLAKKLKLPGSKDEGLNTLYDQEWYQEFRIKQDKFYNNKSKYAKSKGWSDYESDNPYPEADKNLQKAMDAYFALPSGTGQRSAFIRNNPDTWAAITNQWDKQNAWTDKEREKLGLPKIARDEDKKTYSYGGGGKRGAKYDWTKDLFGSSTVSSGSVTKRLRKILEEATLKA